MYNVFCLLFKSHPIPMLDDVGTLNHVKNYLFGKLKAIKIIAIIHMYHICIIYVTDIVDVPPHLQMGVVVNFVAFKLFMTGV